MHHNADYDEVILYVGGDDWSKVTEPGNLTWVPKGVTHWGPREVTNGHLAWLLEVGGILRFTEAGWTRRLDGDRTVYMCTDVGADAQ